MTVFTEGDWAVERSLRRDNAGPGLPLHQSPSPCHSEPHPGDVYQGEMMTTRRVNTLGLGGVWIHDIMC